MAANKFDNSIKHLLENRTISPSNNAWDTLAHRLDDSKKNTSKKWVVWSGVAASFVGVLIALMVFKSDAIHQDIVKNPDIIKVETNISEPINPKEIKILDEVRKTPLVLNTKESKFNSIKNSTAKTEDRLVEKTMIVKQNNITSPIESIQKDLAVSIKNPSEVLKPKNTLSINEADRLLAEALLKTNTITKTQTLDAASLLYDVETEVDQTFRTKLFATIKNNISELKTVIVDRNK